MKRAPRHAAARAILLALALAPLALGCSKEQEPPPGPPPTEKLSLVAVTASPLLAKPEAKRAALEVLHAGDLVYVLRPVTEKGYDRIDWRGELDGVKEARSGATFAVVRAHLDATLYGFHDDYPTDIEVPARGWICDQMKRASAKLERSPTFDSCADWLRRARLPSGALVAYVPCQTSLCPLAVLQGDAVHVIGVEGLLTARLAVLPEGGGDAMIATTRFVRADGAWTGGHVVVIGFAGGAPVIRSETPLDEIDARDPTVVKNRVVTYVISPTGVEITGDSRNVARADGKELSTEPIREKRRLTRDGQLLL